MRDFFDETRWFFDEKYRILHDDIFFHKDKDST
jgi:hypothetical protein